jgi:uncharacterized protein YbjT (DUF2867 family)
MHVLIIGGHGRTALLLGKLLDVEEHQVTGTYRDLAHAVDLSEVGMNGVLLDLARADTGELGTTMTGVDAVVYAAGAGYGSSSALKQAIDRDAAVRTVDAAQSSGVRRFVMISSMGADLPPSPGAFGEYLELKGEADAVVRSTDLDWTIVRPSGLSDAPGTGRIRVGDKMTGGTLPRADLAALLARVLVRHDGVRRQFEVTSGDQDLATVPL